MSIAQLLDRQLDVEEILQCFLKHLQENYELLRKIKNSQLSTLNSQLNSDDALHQRYNSLLYRLNEYHTYALPSGERFRAKIVGTAPNGALCLEDEQGKIKDYLFKEVEFVIF